MSPGSQEQQLRLQQQQALATTAVASPANGGLQEVLRRSARQQAIWGFHEMGVPLVIIYFNRNFRERNHLSWGTSIY